MQELRDKLKMALNDGAIISADALRIFADSLPLVKMAYLGRFIKEKYILVLLGPSGSGKTTYGQNQLNRDERSQRNVMFLSTGLELRKQKILSTWQEPCMTAAKDFCHKLIDQTVQNFKVSAHQVLILDCVKDLEDAEYIDAEIKKHGLEVTRALLFDISPDDLHKHWMRRAEDRDFFRGSPNSYLKNWNTKSNDLLNYYKKLGLLCSTKPLDQKIYVYSTCPKQFSLRSGFIHPSCAPSLSSYRSYKFFKYRRVFPSRNNLHFVLSNSIAIKNILAELLSILRVNQFQFALPASFVHCHRDVTWVADPLRYYVTAKADGVRCLLLKVQGKTYLITRKNEIYPCCIENCKLPDNTVLDGELLPSTSVSEIHPKITTLLKTSVFLVIDVLAYLGDFLWKWPFSVRQECLYKLPISKDITTVMERASADNECVATEDQKLQSSPSEENSQNVLMVNCVVKEHKRSTSDEVLTCLGSLSQLSYACDGLVFTPNTAYVFGQDPLLFKWQSQDSVHCDILYKELDSGKRKCVIPSHFSLDRFNSKQKSRDKKSMAHFWHQLNGEDIIQCQWNQLKKAWDPLFLRPDKSTPNSDETIGHVEKLSEQPYSVEHLVADLTEIGTFPDNHKDSTTTCAPVSNTPHPTVSYSFDELYTKVTELVQLGYVEKTADSGSNLKILSYMYTTLNVKNPLVSMCRGLVLHPDSKTIVTKPFVRFFEDVGQRNLDEDVEATIKYDGSLGIAFLWNGEVEVTTKRRMDSEQATWAKQWLVDHCNLTMFEAGYTYLFEIIYQSNTVAVSYLFEGLVLLAITDKSGCELPYEEVLHFSKAMGFFMATPRITGPYSEVMWYCGGIDLTMQESTNSNQPPGLISGALPINKRQEGWVVKFKDGTRQKIIYQWRKKVSKMAHLVHPQIVWLLVKHDRVKELLGNVPGHFRKEIYSLIRALGKKFLETVRDVEERLRVSSLKSHLSRETGNKSYGAWRRSSVMVSPLVPDESEDSGDDSDEELVIDESNDDKPDEELVIDESNDSEDDSGEDSLKFLLLRKQTKRMCLDEKIHKMLELKKTFELKKLVRKLKRFRRNENPNSFLETNREEEEVNFSPFYNSQKDNYLRLPILEYICPATSPVLDGYEPSNNFKQTWCKGWKNLPINQFQFIQEVLQKNHQVPPFLRLPVEMIVLLLEFLDGRSLALMRRVCMQLRRIVESSKALKMKITLVKIVVAAEEEQRQERLLEMDMYSRYHCSSYDRDNDWSGYGSF